MLVGLDLRPLEADKTKLDLILSIIFLSVAGISWNDDDLVRATTVDNCRFNTPSTARDKMPIKSLLKRTQVCIIDLLFRYLEDLYLISNVHTKGVGYKQKSVGLFDVVGIFFLRLYEPSPPN